MPEVILTLEDAFSSKLRFTIDEHRCLDAALEAYHTPGNDGLILSIDGLDGVTLWFYNPDL
jgi:hypothetical protein